MDPFRVSWLQLNNKNQNLIRGWTTHYEVLQKHQQNWLFFFFEYKTEFIRYSSPLNQKNRVQKLIIVGLVLPASSYNQSIKRAIMIKFSQTWNILRGLRKHERYVACMGELTVAH